VTQSLQILKEMGIDVWTTRDVTVPVLPKPSLFIYKLSQAGKLLGYLLVKLTEKKEGYSSEEAELVNAMCRAMQVEFESEMREMHDLSDLAPVSHVFILGDFLAAGLQEGLKRVSSSLIVLHSPTELLTNRSYKVQSWEKIKKVMQQWSVK